MAYYTGVVFEGFDRSGDLRALCGGGRYDGLLSSLSGGKEAMSAVGFGFGDAVIVELLKIKELLPDFSQNNGCEVVLYVMRLSMISPNSSDAESMTLKALQLANLLRQNGINVKI